MTYETMDWEAEAKRVAAAFGLKGKCELVESEPGVFLLSGEDNVGLPTSKDGLIIDVLYDIGHRHFLLNGNNGTYGEICVSWDNSLVAPPTAESEARYILAHAFCCLQLLTPEIESALQVSISTHQKLELMLEFEQRMKASQH